MAEPETALDVEAFFALVETHLSPAMADLGHHRIHGTVNDQPSSRSSNTLSGRGLKKDLFLWFEYGFEAGSQEVKRLVGPEDPESEDEWWVNYEPSTGRLELGDWMPVAEEYVDWDLWRDDGPCSVLEVERRLVAVGRAVLTFVQQHGGFPITS